MTHTTWRKPAGCDTGHCLEVATDVPGLRDGDIAIRESVRPGTVVVTSRANFAAFVAACQNGEYDDLCEDRKHYAPKETR
jgi:hypothetical protein